MRAYNDITLHLSLTHAEEEDIKIFQHYGFDADSIGDDLDSIFTTWLYAQHKDEGSFSEASDFHYTITNVKKILRALAPSLKKALNNKENGNDGK